ncbi:MAG: hypothetical protein AB7I18_14830, partial [Candidatus Berkiella sp.]
MRCLNESIARYSNKEEDKMGRFWEGRFKSQALLDEGALLSAMVYVDLNPIRAKIAETPEGSDFTSIQDRLKSLSKSFKNNPTKNIEQICNQAKQPKHLMPFSVRQNNQEKILFSTIDFTLSDYIQLVDETGRITREDKKGAISQNILPILSRLQLNAGTWISMINNLQTGFSYAIGHMAILKEFGRHYQCKAPKGLKLASQSYFVAA